MAFVGPGAGRRPGRAPGRQPLGGSEPAPERSAELGPLAEGTLAGTRIGAYRLESPLGEGGSGTVWRARRDDGRFEGQVAIKLLHLSRLGPAALARFPPRREGGILARLTHPNIARLFDAGITAGGQPYLVLELVEGESIDSYADRHALDVDRRIALFQQVVLAVTHAHSHLAVHRDIKPGNILVDGDGVVKLLDFGIAKLLEDESADDDARTVDGARLLTPGYAAPEQLRGEPVTTATDVYALGVVLFGLLAGSHPTRPDRSNPAEALRATLEFDPGPLYSAVPIEGPAAARNAAERSTTPQGLVRSLRGDLSNIVARCLRRAPDERYTTAAALGDDLRRHLEHEPVQARASSLLYRAGKFARKHRLAVISAALTGSLLVLATVVSTWQMLEARRQRQEATAQAAKAQASSRFLGLMVGEMDAEGGALSPTQLLDRGMYLLDQQHERETRPMVDELNQMGMYYARLNETDKEVAVFGRAEALARRLAYDEGLIETLCDQVDTELTLGHRDRAQARLAEAQGLIGGLRRPQPCSRPLVARRQRRSRTPTVTPKPRFAPASRRWRCSVRAATTTIRSMPRRSARISKFHDDLGHALKAHEYTELAGRAYDRAGSGGSIDKLTILNNEASDLMNFGEVRQALEVTTDLMRRLQARGTSAAVGVSFKANHGAILSAIGRHGEALATLDQVIAEAGASKTLFWQQRAQFFRARTLVRAGRWPEAKTALDEIEKAYRSDEVQNQGFLQGLAISRAEWLLRTGDVEAAQRLMDRLLHEVGYPAESSSWVLRGALPLASEIALARGDVAGARAYAQAGVDLARAAARDPDRSADLGRTLVLLAAAQHAAGDDAAAQQTLRQAVPALAGGLGRDHAEVESANARLAVWAKPAG